MADILSIKHYEFRLFFVCVQQNKFHLAALVFWQWWIESGVLHTIQTSNTLQSFFHSALFPSSLEDRGFKPAPIPCVELVWNLLLSREFDGIDLEWAAVEQLFH